MEAEDEYQKSTAIFLSWLQENGVRMNPKMKLADLRSEGRGRGVVAVDDFLEDEVVFSIPRAAVLNVKNSLTASNTSTTQSAADTLSALPPWLALTAVLVSEGSRQDSKWSPYLAVLPRELDSLVFWNESELAELQASAVVNKIGRSSAEDMFSQHIAPLGLNNCNTELCHRVASIIMAYAFDIPELSESDPAQNKPSLEEDGDDLVSDDGEDERTVLSMIPLADMLNADADRNNARLCCDNEDLEMRTIKPISKGEEIFNDYGQLPQSDLLRRYGYQSDNYAVYDVAEMPTTSIMAAVQASVLPQLEPLSATEVEKRIGLAQREDIYEDSYDVAHADSENPSIPDELLALLYILLLDHENIQLLENSQSSLPSRSKLATELVGQLLAAILKEREKEYSTTLEEDAQLLESELPRRTTMAIKVRMGEKEVLREALQEASSFQGSNKRMRLLDNTESAAANSNGKGKRSREETTRPKKKGRYN
ncbi:putative ribosomal N-lysine methyltransferase 4 [Coleophoma cylindrospora]|uniref:Putative ribosomal N-lysine methyltransferase 4 n=1 Tax=Coleophoma cylindrospora TaxID=1849047 RepID=A0A3D8SSW1_9HELO|nr:putative ribosomal N-lysine methyltransferase 4 [Coleophoma cylindrospora]